MSVERDGRRWPIRLVDAIVGLGEALHLPSRPLDGEAILAHARRRTGLEDAGHPSAAEGLSVLARSLREEAALSPFGRAVLRDALRISMERRLRLVDAFRSDPGIGAQEIRRPVFILGMPRTGTTLLFNLLALDDAFRPLLHYETLDPFPRGRARGGVDPRIAKARRDLRLAHWMMPGLAAIHPVTADGPEECLALLMRSFASGAWRLYAHVPSFDEWLLRRPDAVRDEVYRFHRDQLRLLQMRRAGGRWLLKSPAHLQSMHALMRVYDDAVVVRTHRDLAKVLPSAASLLATVRELFSPRLDRRALGPFLLASVESNRSVLMDPLPPGMRERVVDVRYADLMADPVAVVERIRAACGEPSTPAVASAIEGYLRENPKNKAGVHRYDLATYGLDEADILRRTAPYYEAFKVPREARTT